VTRANPKFPSEKEAKAFIGLRPTESEVLAQFGSPSFKDSPQNGVVTWDYLLPPPSKPTYDRNVYAGFEVYFKNGKAFDVTIITASHGL
jgi:hypothetical protein